MENLFNFHRNGSSKNKGIGRNWFKKNTQSEFEEHEPLLSKGSGAASTGNPPTGGGVQTAVDMAPQPRREVGPVRRRWFILGLFAITSMTNAAHWIMYSIITDVIEEHYNVSFLAVNWTAVVFMVAYVPLVFPASWLIDKYGLRVALILCTVLMTIGAWIKVFAVEPHHFILAFAGQALIGVAQMFTLGAPGRLAALWFGAREVSLACALGVFGNQLGVAIGFLVPPFLVQSGENTASQLRILCQIYAAVPTVIVVLIIVFFSNKPPRPPSAAQAAAAEAASNNESQKSFFSSIKALLSIPNFLLLLACYGLTAGSFYALNTVLNPLILSSFEGANKEVGSVGLTMVLVGVMGSVVGGIVLDAWHRYKQTTIVAILLGGGGMAIFAVALQMYSMPAVYGAASLLGFFTAGFVPVAYEFSAELTYPMPEATVVGLLNASGELTAIGLSQGGAALLKRYGNLATMVTYMCTLTLALVLCCFIKNDLKRLAAMRLAEDHRPSIALDKKSINNDLKA